MRSIRIAPRTETGGYQAARVVRIPDIVDSGQEGSPLGHPRARGTRGTVRCVATFVSFDGPARHASAPQRFGSSGRTIGTSTPRTADQWAGRLPCRSG